MNVQLKQGWVLQKRQFLMVLTQFPTTFPPPSSPGPWLRCHFPSSVPPLWPSSRNSKFCCTHNMKWFSFSVSYPQGKGSSSSRAPRALCPCGTEGIAATATGTAHHQGSSPPPKLPPGATSSKITPVRNGFVMNF